MIDFHCLEKPFMNRNAQYLQMKKSRIRTNCLFYGFRLTAEKHLRFYKLLHQLLEHYLKNETMSYLHFCSVSHILRAGVHNYLDVNVK